MLKSQEELMKLTACLGLPTEFDMEFCCNTRCNTKAANLVEASPSAVLYLGLPKSIKNERLRICKKCVHKAEEFEKNSINLLKSGGNLFSLKPEFALQPNDLVTIIDLEQEEDESGGTNTKVSASGASESSHDEPCYSVNLQTFETHLAQALSKFNLTKQVEMCFQKTSEEVTELEHGLNDFKNDMEKAMDQISNITGKVNRISGAGVKTIELGVIDMNDNGSYKVTEMEGLTEQLKLCDIKRCPVAVANFRKTLTSFTVFPVASVPLAKKKTDSKQKRQSQKNGLQAVQSRVIDLATHSSDAVRKLQRYSIKFRPPVKNQMVYAMYGDLKSYWKRGKLLEVIPGPDASLIFKIQLPNGLPPNGYGSSGTGHIIKTHIGKHVAFGSATPEKLPVGTRVISKFDDLFGNNAGFDGLYFAGVVAEPAEPSTKNRYLIFYDDGYVQYVETPYVLPVVQSSENVWEDVDPDAASFIEEYLISYPYRDKLEAKVGRQCSVEFDGTWYNVTIKEVDCSLMKIQYAKKSNLKQEWIYRGSDRIKNRCKNKKPKLLSNGVASNGLSTTIVQSRSVEGANGFQNLDGIVRNYEKAGEMRIVDIPRTCPLPSKYVPHECSPNCCILRYDEAAYKGVSPLVVPFYMGWARSLDSTQENLVAYVSPCGLKLGSYLNVLEYNRVTKNDIPIEFYSFESQVDCLNTFHPFHRLQFIKDISYGKEWTPVQCVNSIDSALPNHLEYRSNRRLGESVKMEKDEGFLVCCDCEDDCQDKSKCACWKLTMEGISFKSSDGNDQCTGYENRRLKQVVKSGIYECNQRCKCNVRTCLNRVVQNTVKWPLQIFKTVQKGWGARSLYDIPAGSYICLYSGKLMNDTQANQEGIHYGDEYFADLDFIEVLESMKEGYEADCIDIEMEDAILPKKPKLQLDDVKTPVARKSTSGARTAETKRDTRSTPIKNSSYHGKALHYRKYFGDDHESPYIMDGKREGNIGRYFNHSCDPNLFIQNVFVDTQDLRFPWLAFFTNKIIKAGTELCWDYNYEVGSVPNKSLICYCGSKDCRKQLL
ncbi:unnamed protein product [Orchesella dallaii]|uniref:Histone-lysine N-methyltransferase eggless n=1 Tax=Orchesella dallaii TaxID=48710 RepID=A0ABP1R8E8_9HEXA